jgi:hypothetical protein
MIEIQRNAQANRLSVRVEFELIIVNNDEFIVLETSFDDVTRSLEMDNDGTVCDCRVILIDDELAIIDEFGLITGVGNES